MNPYDTLAKADSTMVFTEPFLHCIVPNALDEKIYRRLDSEFPLDHFISDDDVNARVKKYADPDWTNVSKSWQSFFEFHSSTEFINKLLDLFKDVLPSETYQKYYSIAGTAPKRIISNMLFGANGLSKMRVHNPHLDHANNLYVGLFYLRSETDKSLGGDLEVYKKITTKPTFEGVRSLPMDQVSLAKIVPYAPNTAFYMFTSEESFHGVSPRINASEYRRYVNINTRVRDRSHTR